MIISRRDWVIFAMVALPCFGVVAYKYFIAQPIEETRFTIEVSRCFNDGRLGRKNFMKPIKRQLREERNLQDGSPQVAIRFDKTFELQFTITTGSSGEADARRMKNILVERTRARMLEQAGADIFPLCANIGPASLLKFRREPWLWKRSLVSACLAICLALVAVRIFRVVNQ